MAQRTDFTSMACSIARSWAVIGEPWTPLILRDLAFGITRFDDLRTSLGIARNVLADRLRTLTDAGVVAKQQYASANRRRHEYVLTPMGKELVPIIAAITQWGDRWLDEGGGPPVTFHHTCGAPATLRLVCNHCSQELTADEMTPHAGPGSRKGPGTYAVEQLPKAP